MWYDMNLSNITKYDVSWSNLHLPPPESLPVRAIPGYAITEKHFATRGPQQIVEITEIVTRVE